MEFACSPRVRVGFLRVLRFPPQSKDMQVRLTGDSKLTVGVNVSVNGCLCLCVSPVMTWRLVQGVPRLSPVVSWDRLQLACDPVEQDKAATDNEMR